MLLANCRRRVFIVNMALRMYTLLREIMARPSYSRANNRLTRHHEKYRSTSHRFGCGTNVACPGNLDTMTSRYFAPAAVM